MQRVCALLVGVLIACLPWMPGHGAAQSADVVTRSAMAPYYAALLASARADADGTVRHLIVFESRWSELTRRSKADLPAWLRDTTGGRSVAAAVAAKIAAARQHLPRNVGAAHAELETVRVLLRDARARHGVRTEDDALTDYHDAIERLASHTGAASEIALTASDFSIIRDDVARARSAWREVESPRGLAAESGWANVAAGTNAALRAAATAADRQDAQAAQQASGTLKDRYFDLLAILSRRR